MRPKVKEDEALDQAVGTPETNGFCCGSFERSRIECQLVAVSKAMKGSVVGEVGCIHDTNQFRLMGTTAECPVEDDQTPQWDVGSRGGEQND